MKFASTSFILLFVTTEALAGAPSADTKREAATSFDDGLRHASLAEYDAAARAFLRADALVPNATALTNAIAAAHHANADLLLVEAAQRGLERGDAELATASRDALLDAEKRLARLELACDPMPCTLRVDGVMAASGDHYVLAGDHVIEAIGDGSFDTSERISAIAGTRHRVSLSLRHREDERSLVITPLASTSPLMDAPHVAPTSRPLSPAIVYTGAAVTLVLAGVMTWSGLHALASKPNVDTAYTLSDKDDFHANIRRTNYLLATTAIVGAATAVLGFTLVDWGTHTGDTASVWVTPNTASLVFRGTL